MTIKLGIAPINWTNDDDPALGGDISFAQCIQEMSVAGYVGTELGNRYPRDPQVLSTALSDQGLQLASAWFSTFFTEPGGHDKTLSAFLDHLSFMRAMGAKYINICECGHAIQGKSVPAFGLDKPVFTDSQWQQLIQGLHSLGRIAHEFNIRLVYHYHVGTGVFSLSEIDCLMQHTSPALLSLLLDTGHAAVADINPLDLIERYGERIAYVHLKDIRMAVFKAMQADQLCFMDGVRMGLFTVPGDGYLDFPEIIDALRDQNYQGWMIVEAEQDPAQANPLHYAQMARNYLRAFI